MKVITQISLQSIMSAESLSVNLAATNGDEVLQELLAMVHKEHPLDRKSTRLNSSHTDISRMPSSA